MNGTDMVPIGMVLFVAMFALTVVGFALYLRMTGALRTPGLRPFRFAVYILLLICAMTVGIGLIQLSYGGCCAPLL